MRLERFRLVGLIAVLGLVTIPASFGGPDPGRREGGTAGSLERLDLVVSEQGVRILPAFIGVAAWDFGFSLDRYGRPDDLRAAGVPSVQSGQDEVKYLRGPLFEWFRNGPAGIEHGLEIQSLEQPSLLWLEYALLGNLTPKISEDGQTVVFRDTTGAQALLALELQGLDAEGREVSARWERVEHGDARHPFLRLEIDGADHALPIRLLERFATPKKVAGSSGSQPAMADLGVLSAPAGDLCPGAEIVPGAGPFPYLSSVIDITDATDAGDPPPPTCQANVSHGVWFAFTPASTADYSFSTCADAPTATTVEDTVLAIYSAAGLCAGLTEMGGGCGDDACGPGELQAAIPNVRLSAGLTYYIVVWSYGTAVPLPGAESLQLQVIMSTPPGPAPPNDLCSGAEAIPGAGPFPYLTSVTADIGGATSAGDPPVPSCQPGVSRSIWYSFTPLATGRYAFSVCADGPTGTTVDDTVLAVFAEAAFCSGFLELSGGCDDDSCASEAAQSAIPGVSLTAGTRYDIVVWKYGSAVPASGNTAVQMRVTRVDTPPNDSCTAAPALTLEAPLSGTTVSATDDTRLPSGSACFTGIGQTPSTAAGGDVAYRFTAQEAGRYSFRVSGYDASKNVVLYAALDCPGGVAPSLVAGCLGAANRSAAGPEEIACLPLAAGQMVYVYVDEGTATSGSSYTMEASRCPIEIEPNGAPALARKADCGAEGSISPGADADFFELGTAASGSRLFAVVDGAAGNSSDFDLRVTTDTDTLEYDDFNNDVAFGSAAPNVSGTRLTGIASYAMVSHYSPVAQAEPYRLYASIQPSAANATPEVEPDDSIGAATAGANEYYSGALASPSDVDIFSFPAAAGDLVQIGLDLDPSRDGTPFNGSLALLAGTGATLLLVNDPSVSSSNLAGTGSLNADTPYSPGEAMVFRVRTTGTYFAKVAWSGGTPGDYLLSLSHNCRVAPPTDLAVSQSDTPDPAPAGGTVTYSIVVANTGAHPASVVAMSDDLPAGAALVSASSSHGTCAGSGPVVCQLGDLPPGGAATVNLVVTAPGSPGLLTNQARVSMAVIDASPGNDASAETTVVGSADGDGDGAPDAADCAPADSSAWAIPGEATGLVFPSAVDPTLIQWSAPASTGGTVVRFDLLRSAVAANLQAPTCLAVNTIATTANDAAVPSSVFFYLVRSRNVCGGNLGARSDGTPRVAGSCP